jgi:hypothetical protein
LTLLIILTGSIGRSVTGGQAWANLHYLLGLRALGHDVYYLEDAGDWSETYDWRTQCNTDSLDHPARFLRETLESHGFADKWMYRTSHDCRGMSLDRLRQLCRCADLLLIRGVPMLRWRQEYDEPRRRAFIDVDPGFTQLRLLNQEPAFVETIAHCESLFTFATQIGQPGCKIPTAGRAWRPTVPPVDREAWPPAPPVAHEALTTIVRWRGVHDVKFDGIQYGQRDKEFPKFFALPSLTGTPFRVALIGGGREALTSHGWEVVDGGDATANLDNYREFIVRSRAEFGVAKQCYVETRGGWISDRSVSYLAAGRPVIVQNTGVGDEFLSGRGMITFHQVDEAVAAVAEVNAHYQEHAAAALSLARDCYDAQQVLSRLIDEATVS